MKIVYFFLASNPIHAAYHGSDLFGKGIFLSLFILSIITWIILLQKILQNRKARIGKELFFKTLGSKKEKIFSIDLQVNFPHPFYRITENLKEKVMPLIAEQGFLAEKDKEVVAAHIAAQISQEAKRLKEHLSMLSTTISLAPFLGLLGTVWGILITFEQLQIGATAASSQIVMGGLSMALGTTVCGLVVAIPALIAYNSLKNKIADLTIEMEDYGKLLLAYLELGYGK